jgi:hypothetical protein
MTEQSSSSVTKSTVRIESSLRKPWFAPSLWTVSALSEASSCCSNPHPLVPSTEMQPKSVASLSTSDGSGASSR